VAKTPGSVGSYTPRRESSVSFAHPFILFVYYTEPAALVVSEQFQFNVTYLYTWDGPVGTCFFYQDIYCNTLVSPDSGIDMCGSDSIHWYQTDVDFSSYVGSAMCI
jgi:hypothetical protein